MIVISLTMPAEFGLFNAFKDNISKGNTKGILGSLGGVIATPVLAEIIATFLSNYITPQPISKILPRPTLPSITMPTPTLQYSPTPTQTLAPSQQIAPPTATPPPSIPITQPTTTVKPIVGSVASILANQLSTKISYAFGSINNLSASILTSVNYIFGSSSNLSASISTSVKSSIPNILSTSISTSVSSSTS